MHSTNLKNLLKLFSHHFSGVKPMVIRAPGRINLIGEHTDYNGLPVLPLAINLELNCACSPRKDHQIRIVNDSDFSPAEFEISDSIIKSPYGSWGNYPKAAAQALAVYLKKTKSLHVLKGFNGVLSSSIPIAAGLSSSSAIVVCIAMVLKELNALTISKLQMAELLAEGEKYVGAEGGGMDQTVILNAKENCAQYIEFFPIRIQNIPFPKQYAVMICNSMLIAKKSAEIRHFYNHRTVECRLGLAMLKKQLNRLQDPSIKRLGDLVLEEAIEIRKTSMFNEEYSLEEISTFCEKPMEQIRKECLTLNDGSVLEAPNDGSYKIGPRIMHVLTEGIRVRQSVQFLKENSITALGRLMNDSHESCDRNYEISTPEINKLVSICRSNGAIGSRLTGAGFGGCVISLIKQTDKTAFQNLVAKQYYEEFLRESRPDLYSKIKNPHDQIYEVTACPGASRVY